MTVIAWDGVTLAADKQGNQADYGIRVTKIYRVDDDLIGFAGQNQWKNFRPGERDYEYYMAKADVYNRILAEIV